jgi:hypothetical protein
MPLVRITGWQRGLRPSLPPAPLLALFVKEIGMDGSDAEAAVRRLMKGKFVDASFDLGEDKAARAFMREVATFGLTASLYQDEPLSWSGSRPRPLFLKLSLAALVGFVICLWLFGSRPHATISKAFAVLEGLLIICWLYSGTGGILERRPQTQEQKERGEKLKFWWTLGSFALFALIGTIINEPMYAVILLIVAVGGIGCAFLIRMMNRD